MINDSPRIANVLLWFPLSSETFIFRESLELMERSLIVHHYTMYGKSLKGCSAEMIRYKGPVTRFGLRAFLRIWRAFAKALLKNPGLVTRLMGRGLFRKMRNIESQAENIWCFMAGFLLAEYCVDDKVDLIHAPWANGPATAAWVASKLTGIPFGFSGRAGDIYPEDGILAEKAADAAFIRTNNAANVAWLQSFCPMQAASKVHLVYNGLTFSNHEPRPPKEPRPPYKILAVGRFARTKGFPDLLSALVRLRREGLPVSLTLVGDGSWKRYLQRMIRRLNLDDSIQLPGFVPNDQLEAYMRRHDLLVVPSVIHANGDRDGIPNVIMEASSLGLPVVATNVCGIGEVIENGKTGLLVEQRNPAALARAIRQQLENPNKAREMALEANCRVIKMFDNERNSKSLADLYLSAMKKKNA